MAQSNVDEMIGTVAASKAFGGTKERYRLAASLGKVAGAKIVSGVWTARRSAWKHYVENSKMGRPKKK